MGVFSKNETLKIIFKKIIKNIEVCLFQQNEHSKAINFKNKSP
jgi:hypothetical protein